jgi:tRNA pseudouridine38-40 synthase
MRVKAVISYDGSHYYGFQKQTSTHKTITAAIEKALKELQIFSEITGSGRTDAGVHATGQVIHFDLPEYWHDLKKLKLNLNRKLHDIYIKHITKVESEFHARFSAKKRLYRYVFKTSRPSIFEQNYVSYYQTFDSEKLREALDYFVGEHDFTFFRKTGSDTYTTIRTIFYAHYVERKGYHFIYFKANGFLRSQVRMMVDAALSYAKNEISLKSLQEQINATTQHTSRLAPPEGLYLANILY